MSCSDAATVQFVSGPRKTTCSWVNMSSYKLQIILFVELNNSQGGYKRDKQMFSEKSCDLLNTSRTARVQWKVL